MARGPVSQADATVLAGQRVADASATQTRRFLRQALGSVGTQAPSWDAGPSLALHLLPVRGSPTCFQGKHPPLQVDASVGQPCHRSAMNRATDEGQGLRGAARTRKPAKVAFGSECGVGAVRARG
jgi:hypothetical protein